MTKTTNTRNYIELNMFEHTKPGVILSKKDKKQGKRARKGRYKNRLDKEIREYY